MTVYKQSGFETLKSLFSLITIPIVLGLIWLAIVIFFNLTNPADIIVLIVLVLIYFIYFISVIKSKFITKLKVTIDGAALKIYRGKKQIADIDLNNTSIETEKHYNNTTLMALYFTYTKFGEEKTCVDLIDIGLFNFEDLIDDIKKVQV